MEKIFMVKDDCQQALLFAVPTAERAGGVQKRVLQPGVWQVSLVEKGGGIGHGDDVILLSPGQRLGLKVKPSIPTMPAKEGGNGSTITPG